MLWTPIQDLSIVRQTIARAMNMQDQNQRERITQMRQFYGGDMTPLVLTALYRQFTDPTERAALVSMVSPTVNLLRFIVKTLAVVYRYGAKRTWHNAAETIVDGKRTTENQDITKTYERIGRQCELNDAMMFVDRMTLLTGDCIMRYEYGKWGHRLFPMTRDVCDVVQDADDPRKALGVLWSVMRTDTPIYNGNLTDLLARRWYFTDAYTVTELDSAGNKKNVLPNPYAPLNERHAENNVPYPFVDFHDEYRPYTFWREFNDDSLINMAVDVCVWLTYLNGQLKYSTFKQLYEIPGPAAAMAPRPPEQVMSWTSVYKGPAGGALGILDYQCAIETVMSVLRDRLELFCTSHGVPSGLFTVQATQSMSGIAIKLDRVTLTEMRNERVPRYVGKEQSIARMTQFASNYGYVGYPTADIIPADLDPAMMHVELGEPQEAVDPAQDREQWQWEFDKGIATPADYLMAKTPNLTKQAANDIVKANKAQKTADEASMSLARVSGMTAPEPTVTEE